MKKNLIITFIFIITFISGLYAQHRSISGTVTAASDGQPLPGVTVVVQGVSNIGTVTDADGKYSISVPADAKTLVFSFIGMERKVAEIGNSAVLNVEMEMSTEALDEVVVTALGISRQTKSLGYSVQEVSGEELIEARETNLANSLAGKVAGVQVTNIATGAGGSSRIVIRGNSSISGNDAPLYVVDGIPIDNQNLDAPDYAAGGVDYGDGIVNLNPDDIKSMSVLKGPNAAALYGARAANGVIVITTKSGKSRKGLGVSVNSNYTFEDVATLPTYQNKFGPGYFSADGFEPIGTTVIDGQEYPILDPSLFFYYGPKLEGQLVADWQDPTKVMALNPQPDDNVRNFFQTGYTATNTISFTGGNEQSTFYLSLSDLRNEGIIPGSKYNRQSINFRGTTNITSKFSIDAKVNYVHHEGNNRPGVAANSSNIMSQIIQWPNHIDMERLKNYKDENGNPVNWTTRYENPYWTINEIQNEDARDRVIGFVSLKYDFNDWLSLQARTGTDFYTDQRFERRAVGTTSARTGLVSNYTFHVTENNSDILLMADKELSSDFSGSLTLGASHLYSKNEVTGAKGIALRTPGLYHIDNAAQITPRYRKVQREMNSVFAAGQLGYRNYLFLDLTARNDWSSVLGMNNYSFFYPSATASFVLTDAFQMNSNVLSFAKLRAGYAEVGNDSSPYLTSYGYQSLSETIQSQGQAEIQNRIPNPDLKNELTSSYEFGADARLFNNRARVDFTYYNSSTKNQILPVNISSATGFGQMVINAGEITNEGIELLLDVTPVQLSNSFRWDLTFNYAKNRSKVVSLADGIETHEMSRDRWGTIEARPGNDFGNIVGYGFKRNEKGEKLLNENGQYQRDPDEVKVLGNIQPDWIGGITNRFSYKGFSLKALIDIKMGGNLLSGTKYIQTARGTAKFTEDGIYENADGIWVGVADGVMENDYYVEDEEGNMVLHLRAGEKSDIELERLQLHGWYTRADIIEAFVLDASYVSLREVALGYSFPPSLLRNTPIANIKMSVVGRNLLYIHENMEGLGISPEGAFSAASGAQGSESYTLPSTRSFGFNLTVEF